MTIGPHLLGRHVNHDPRSRNFGAVRTTPAQKSVWWHPYGLPLDQGDVGSCTADALCQWRNTLPEHQRGQKMLRQADALALYHAETEGQGGPVYPPDDPGGSGLEVCKAAVKLKLIGSYTHAFGIDHARGVITTSPFLVGSNWYSSMFECGADGLITVDGEVVGGHEFLCTGYSPRLGLWRFRNSWGPGWGKRGSFYLTSDQFSRLLSEDGDITCPVM